VWILVVLGGAFLYLLHGAVSGDLYIPLRRGGGGTHYSGLPAWLIVVAPLLLYVSILVKRERLMWELPARTRTALTITLYIAALSALVSAALIRSR
jgi:hypothetical protein